MRLGDYLYLAVFFLAALAVLALCIHNNDLLTRKTTTNNRFELFVLCSILIIGACSILWNQLHGVGRATLVFRSSANDTNDQYVPYYIDLVRSVRSGSFSLWNHRFGMGSSILGCQEWVFDPFNLILVPLCLFFGEGFMAQALAITFACRSIISGLLFWGVMRYYCETPLARILGAASFAFSGYLFTEGQHYFFGTAWVFLALSMLTLERLMCEQDPRAFIATSVVCAVFICSSIYSAFMTLFFSPLYVALRLISLCEGSHRRSYVRRLSTCALAVFCGCLLSCIILIPTAAYLFGETGRVNGEEAIESRNALRMLTTVMTPRTVMCFFSRLLGNGLLSNGTNYGYLGGLNELEFFQGGLSCGVFILLAQFVYWSLTDASRRTRLAVLAGAGVISFYCFDYFLPSVITVFRYPTYRGCLGIDAVLICAMGVGFERRFVDQPPEPLLFVTASGFTALVLGWSYLHTVNGTFDCLAYALVLVAITVLSFVRINRGKNATRIAVIICAILVASSVADSFCEINLNPKNVSPEDFPLSNTSEAGAETTELAEYLRETDTTFYRVERPYTTWTKWNDSLNFGYRGVSCYNSTEDGDLGEFFVKLWPEAITHTNLNFSCYSFVRDPENQQMMAISGIRYFLTDKPCERNWLKEVYQGKNGGFIYAVIYEGSPVNPLYLRTAVISQSRASALSLEERRALLDTTLIVEDAVAVQFSYPETGTPASIHVSLTENADGSLSGTTSSEADGIACLTIPNTAGWTISIDGKSVPHFTANYGFIGFELTSGTHKIQARYVPTMLGVGSLMSITGLILTIFSATLVARCQRQETVVGFPRHVARRTDYT